MQRPAEHVRGRRATSNRWLLDLGALCLAVFPAVTFVPNPPLLSLQTSEPLSFMMDPNSGPQAYGMIARYDTSGLQYAWLYAIGVALVLIPWAGTLTLWRNPS
ncbi:hypothetical protein [Deinococcus aquiradiocola]|uniref:hypothetical protein n=1 Tax=Deinococcus aquiradiocola TaxID=393059 RepID=UPI001662C1C7|nr:hypothetical protein [Deinococcus aquiradiocola]